MRERAMFAREMPLRTDSINVEARSFEAVAATETIAQIVDWELYEIIDEILVARGGSFPEHTPLLENHQRWSTLDVIGSAVDYRRQSDIWLVRGIRAEPEGESDPVERIWRRVKDRHVRAVSIGYRVGEKTDIPPGKRMTVDGRTYQARERLLRISTRWSGHELSLTPIGADSAALIRSQKGNVALKRRSFFR
jgi:hypothetical protein